MLPLPRKHAYYEMSWSLVEVLLRVECTIGAIPTLGYHFT